MDGRFTHEQRWRNGVILIQAQRTKGPNRPLRAAPILEDQTQEHRVVPYELTPLKANPRTLLTHVPGSSYCTSNSLVTNPDLTIDPTSKANWAEASYQAGVV